MRLKNLEVELRRRGLYQRDLACALGVDRSVVSRILCGHRRARARERRMIADLLKVPAVLLFSDSRVGRIHHVVRRRGKNVAQP
jgi:transcriptional regulator with XRE-family HTH domain